MDTLKKFFPLSFKRADSVANVVIGAIIYVVIGLIAGAVITLASIIAGLIFIIGPIIGWILGILGSLVEIYVVAGIVILILAYLKMIK